VLKTSLGEEEFFMKKESSPLLKDKYPGKITNPLIKYISLL